MASNKFGIVSELGNTEYGAGQVSALVDTYEAWTYGIRKIRGCLLLTKQGRGHRDRHGIDTTKDSRQFGAQIENSSSWVTFFTM